MTAAGYGATAGWGWFGGAMMDAPPPWLEASVFLMALVCSLIFAVLGTLWQWHRMFGPRLSKGLRLSETTPIEGKNGVPRCFLQLEATAALHGSKIRVICDERFYECDLFLLQGGLGEGIAPPGYRKPRADMVDFPFPAPVIEAGSILVCSFQGTAELSVRSVKILTG